MVMHHHPIVALILFCRLSFPQEIEIFLKFFVALLILCELLIPCTVQAAGDSVSLVAQPRPATAPGKDHSPLLAPSEVSLKVNGGSLLHQ